MHGQAFWFCGRGFYMRPSLGIFAARLKSALSNQVGSGRRRSAL